MDPSSRTMVREDVQIIETSLNHVNDLLRSMLDLHRAKSDQLMLEWLPTDMRRDILESVATMLYRRDEEFDVIVECPNDLVFSTDRLRLKQIVLNLARNSAKFVEEGFVRLRAETCGADVLVYIEDSGPGIPEDKRGRLFAKFQESLDSLHQGTGIGLSLCQKLVDLMDGSIQLDESYHSGIEGKPGAKFIIRLPYRYMHEVDSRKPGTGEEQKQIHDGGYINETSILEFEEESCTKGSSVEDLPVVRRCQDVELNASSFTSAHEEIKELPEKLDILFVDDDTVLRKLFSRSLKRARPDWSVSEAANGETALYVVEKQAFDIIFIDQYMTSVEKQLLGTETARLLRSKGVKSILCGLSANDMESAFLRAGANAFMMKPFPCKPEPLMEELKRIYNSR